MFINKCIDVSAALDPLICMLHARKANSVQAIFTVEIRLKGE